MLTTLHNRGSGNTNNSNATTLDSTKRFSTASTDASSLNEDQGDLPFPPRQKYAPIPHANTDAIEPEPQSRKTFSLKAAGRAFSFGAKSAKNIPRVDSDVPPLPNRDRSMTVSSYASTATPPKLDIATGPGLGLGESGFGDIFAKRKSTIMEESPPPVSSDPQVQSYSQQSTSDPQVQVPSTYLSYHTQNAPPRQNTSGMQSYPPREVPPRKTGSPYSWKSGASEERLMASPNPQNYADSPAFQSSSGLNNEIGSSVVLDALNASRFLDSEHSVQPPRHIPETNYPPRSREAHPPPSSYRGPEPPRRSPLSEVMPRTPNASHGGERTDGFSDVDLTPHARNSSAVDDEPLFDAPRPRRLPFRANIRSTTTPASNGKVMTPAEFEEYKKHKENASPEEDAKSEASSESDAYDDDDETDRQKEAAKQRRKQEAHLAVYRQQMMKVTGEQPSELPTTQAPRVPLERSSTSAPSLLGSLSFENRNEQQGSKSSQGEDEDEEVPLGVLQAHGFPNKNRPPTRMSQNTSAASRPESQVANYPPPGGATRNDTTAGGGGNPNLPVFAKNLPQDPYVGASIVNPPARESLAFNNSNSMSSPGAQQHHMSSQPPPQAGGNLPPGGLVGVIATEERAKALRRGSPSARGTYDPVPSMQLPHEIQQQQMMQQMMQQQQMQQPHPQMMSPGTPMPNNPNQISAGEQSQLQIANQMTQMMQMQMQFMQWAMQNNGQMPNGMQMPPGMQASQLPQQNIGGQPGSLGNDPMASAASVGPQQRASSNLSRGPSPGHLSTSTGGLLNSSSQSVYGMQPSGGGYAPSIAPSERSVVGQPSRYRPVTPSGGQNRERESRTSSISQRTVQALNGQRSKSRLRNESTYGSPKPTIKAVERPKHGGHDDDDDDAGWAEMKRQRQARQSKWKQSKTASTVLGAQDGGLEGLLYEGPQA